MLFVIWLGFGVVILFYILAFWSSRINGTGLLYLVQKNIQIDNGELDIFGEEDRM
mgnify:CR=1 FL=1